MKKKSFHKYLFCLLTGMLVVGSISVYAVSTIIDSKEVSYDNKISNGSYDNVQDSIDELYKRYKDLSGEQDTIYTEKILNGADPILGKDMIPITLDSKGNAKYANLYTPWYSYEEKKWANAVILVDNPSQSYKTGDTILEKDIESYFVWIPRYKYKIWNLGTYVPAYTFSNLKDTATIEDTSLSYAISGRTEIIEVIFEDKNAVPSTNEVVGNYYTHPAFTNFGVSGLWIGKFETTGNSSNLTVKPSAKIWLNETIGTFWKSSFNYKNISGNHNTSLDPHMMKNTEWGAAAYLSHSEYGIANEININNNSEYKTGYSAAAGANENIYPGESGTTEDVTKEWNTPTGYLASTTGNITGIYDMSGGGFEDVAGYLDGHGQDFSGLTLNELESYSKYFDKYSSQSTSTAYNYRILGDATGELGPMYLYWEDNSYRYHSSWYQDVAEFVNDTSPWFVRGCSFNWGVLSGAFVIGHSDGNAHPHVSSRLVLAVK